MINFSNTTPAAPSNSQNVAWQSDVSGNVSASVPFTAPSVTTAAKNAISAQPGMVVFDTTLAKLCVYTGGSWETISSS